MIVFGNRPDLSQPLSKTEGGGSRTSFFRTHRILGAEPHWSENSEKGAEPVFPGPSRFLGAEPHWSAEEEARKEEDPVKNGTAQVVWAESKGMFGEPEGVLSMSW